MDISTQTNGIVDALVNNVLATVVEEIQTQAKSQILSELRARLNDIDFKTAIRESVENYIKTAVEKMDFSEGSIPGTAVQSDSLHISADNITTGIIKNFASTGIDDKATRCQVTVLDDFTVVENNLVTADLTIKGTATVEGDLIVRGEIPTDSQFFQSLKKHSVQAVQDSVDQDLFEKFSIYLFDKIRSEGIDLKKISVNGKSVIDANKLSTTITESNLQKVGILKSLETQGESYLSQTLYVSGKRVGINTIEPSSALTVWDEEVEIVAAKLKKDTAVLGTTRKQALVLSSGGKDNIRLEADGSVHVKKLDLGAVSLSSATAPPSHEAPKGTVVFNGNPNLGGPLGWVSLGGARWANFGIIE